MTEQSQIAINDNLIFDVGMHIAQDTNYYLKNGFEVVAFEADPNLVSWAKEKYASEISAGRLHIIEGAICNENKKPNDYIDFYIHTENPFLIL